LRLQQGHAHAPCSPQQPWQQKLVLGFKATEQAEQLERRANALARGSTPEQHPTAPTAPGLVRSILVYYLVFGLVRFGSDDRFALVCFGLNFCQVADLVFK
jgi:hypothetical protein